MDPKVWMYLVYLAVSVGLTVGLVLLVLGVLHFCNVFFLGRYRRGRLRQQQVQPPLPPTGRLPIHPARA